MPHGPHDVQVSIISNQSGAVPPQPPIRAQHWRIVCHFTWGVFRNCWYRGPRRFHVLVVHEAPNLVCVGAGDDNLGDAGSCPATCRLVVQACRPSQMGRHGSSATGLLTVGVNNALVRTTGDVVSGSLSALAVAAGQRCIRTTVGAGGATRPTESSDPTQRAKGRTGDCPGPRKGTTTRRNVTRGGYPSPPPLDLPPRCTQISQREKMKFTKGSIGAGYKLLGFRPPPPPTLFRWPSGTSCNARGEGVTPDQDVRLTQ